MTSQTPDPRFENFGKSVYDSLTVTAPFGSLSKSELELALFSALVEAGIVDPDDRPFHLAKTLRCTPARATSLVFNYRLRNTSTESTKAELIQVIQVVKDTEAARQGRVVLNVEQKYWREVLIDEMKNHGVFTDSSFNRERLTLDAKDFMTACERVFGIEGKQIAAAVKKAKKDATKVDVAEFLVEMAKKVAGGTAAGAGSAAAKAAAGPTLAALAGVIS